MHLELLIQNVLVLLTLQLALFGWRINREINVGDKAREVWLPIPDVLNVVSMVVLVAVCVIQPLSGSVRLSGGTPYSYPPAARAVFAAAAVLLVFHPLTMVAHYGLLSSNGRPKVRRNGKEDSAYFPPQEAIVVAVSVATAVLAVVHVTGH